MANKRWLYIRSVRVFRGVVRCYLVSQIVQYPDKVWVPGEFSLCSGGSFAAISYACELRKALAYHKPQWFALNSLTFHKK